jgi:hypothetical protein
VSKQYKPISLKNVKTCRLTSRKSKVALDEVGKPFSRGKEKKKDP